MIILPGQDIVLRRIGKLLNRYGINLATAILTTMFALAFVLFCCCVYEGYQNRNIEYKVHIDSIEDRGYDDTDGSKNPLVVSCTDDKGNRHSFSYDSHRELVVGVNYLIMTEGSNTRPLRKIKWAVLHGPFWEERSKKDKMHNCKKHKKR